MIVYLAARFSRREELRSYAKALDLASGGRTSVNSRWLFTNHEWAGQDDSAIPPLEAVRFADEDLEDIRNCDVVVCFTDPPRSAPSRGGRHVEYGYTLALNTPVIVVGHRENVFYTLDHSKESSIRTNVLFVDDWEDARDEILRRQARGGA